MKKSTLILRLVLFIGSALIWNLNPGLRAQVTQEWVEQYNGPGNGHDYAIRIKLDPGGNVYVAGVSEDSSGNVLKSDYVLLKYRDDGQFVWEARYDGPAQDDDGILALAVDDSGYVYVTGFSHGGATDLDFATIKYDSSGQAMWIARYDGAGHGTDCANALAVDVQGNVYVAGFADVDPIATRNYNCVTIKYNNLGQEVWTALYSGASDSTDQAFALILDEAGNVIVAGSSAGATTRMDALTLKYDNSGVLQWEQRFDRGWNLNDHAIFLALDGTGQIYAVGASEGIETNYDALVLKYRPEGTICQVITFNGADSLDDQFYAATTDLWGNLHVIGTSISLTSSLDYLTLKYDSLGAEQWVALYDGPGNLNDGPQTVLVDQDDNVYLTGTSDGVGTQADCATLKYDADGQELWVMRYNSGTDDINSGQDMVFAGAGDLIIAGATFTRISGFDIITLKYSQSSGMVMPQPGERALPPLTITSLYPNPFNQGTRVEYTNSQSEFLRFEVTNVQGQRITSWNQWVRPGTHTWLFDGSQCSSGIYFFRISAQFEGQWRSEPCRAVLLK